MKNKLIVITGSTGGIGRVISRSLLDQGHDIVGFYFNNASEVDCLLKYSEDKNGKFIPIRSNFTSEVSIHESIEQIKKMNKKIDGLIHCAASGVHKAMPHLTIKHFKWSFDVNFFSLIQLMTELAELFNKKARVIALSSPGAYIYLNQYSTVGTSKAAIESLIQYIAAEYSDLGIRANVINSGLVLTDGVKKIFHLVQNAENNKRRTPTGRLTEPQDIANLVNFLFSEAAEQINGQVMRVDGGYQSDYDIHIATRIEHS